MLKNIKYFFEDYYFDLESLYYDCIGFVRSTVFRYLNTNTQTEVLKKSDSLVFHIIIDGWELVLTFKRDVVNTKEWDLFFEVAGCYDYVSDMPNLVRMKSVRWALKSLEEAKGILISEYGAKVINATAYDRDDYKNLREAVLRRLCFTEYDNGWFELHLAPKELIELKGKVPDAVYEMVAEVYRIK